MTKKTPTLEEVRAVHAWDYYHDEPDPKQGEAFDRFIAERDKAVTVQALRDAAASITLFLIRDGKPDLNNPAYVYAQHRFEAADILRAMADKVEKS